MYPETMPGGPTTYASLAAVTLGAKAAVVSKVGRDFQDYFAILCKSGVDLSHVQILENAGTTNFVLEYDDGKRKIRLRHRAPRIFLKDLKKSLYSKAVHVAPVANELSIGIIRELRKRTPLLSLDPQGFLRKFDTKGVMELKTVHDIAFLQHFDVYKSSIQEIRVLTRNDKLEDAMRKIQNCGVKIILVTMGQQGAVAYFDEEFYLIPACKPRVVKDPTGAGDAFIGAFLAEYIHDGEVLWCCCVGSAAASFVVEEIGPTQLGEKHQIYKRATKIYEKGIKPLSRNAIDEKGDIVGKN
jgi:sugar/nucleoside kinase (ribokinase family)